MTILLLVVLIFLIMNVATAVFLFVVSPRLHSLSPFGQHSTRIRIGIPNFPDAILLEHGVAADTDHAHYEVIRTPWGGIESQLLEGNLEAAYINTYDAAALCRQHPTKFITSRPLTAYYGFSILVRPASRLRSFSDFYQEFWQATHFAKPMGSDVDADIGRAAAVAFAAQISTPNTSIVAALKTDHLRSLYLFGSAVDASIYTHADSPGEPDDALRFFMSGHGEAFVGGATQRLYGRALGLREIFSHSQFRALLEPEQNSLIVRKDALPVSANKLLASLQAIWYSGLKDLSSSPEARERFCAKTAAHLLPAFLTVVEHSNDKSFSFSDSDLVTLFSDWFNIPGLQWRDSEPIQSRRHQLRQIVGGRG